MAKTNGNTNAKRNTMIVISTVVSFLLFAIAIGLFVYAKYAVNTNVSQSEKSYKIVVNADVTAYEGDEQLLTPHIVAADGSVVPGRFTYEVVDADSAPITVSESGGVSVKEDGDAAEGRIKITELNTQTEVVVSIKVERKLSGIKGVVFGEDLVVATETQELTFGDEYIVTVKTTPSQAVLKNEQLSIRTVDKYGKEVPSVLDYSVVPNTNKVRIRPIGLGAGSMVFSVVADGRELCKDEEYKFNVTMFDQILHGELVAQLKNAITEDKVEQSKIELIASSDIAKLNTITVSEDVQSLHGVNNELFVGLDTVVFPLNCVIALTDDVVCSDICYRVDAKLFDSYVHDALWQDYVYSLIPYEKNALTEKWVVYHGYTEPYDDRELKIVPKQIKDEFIFENFDDRGCTNNYFYTGKDPKPQTDEERERITGEVRQSISSLTKNGMHIEVGYTPNKYTITYVIPDDATAGWQNLRVPPDTWVYGESRKLYTSNDIIDPNTQQAIRKTGYTLTGWRKNDGLTVLSVDDMQVNLVESGSLTLTADWTPISYTIIYRDDSTGDVIEIKQITYGTGLRFENKEKIGYTLEYFKDAVGNEYNATDVYPDVMTEPGTFYLNVHYRENTYTVHLDAGETNDTPAGFMDLTAVRDFTVAYTQQFRLPILNHPDSSSYKWEGRDSAGNKITGMSFLPEAQISMLSDVDGANITLRGTWNPTTYHVVYDLKGFSYTYKEYSEGKLVTKTTTTEYNQERSLDDGLPIITPTRTGYTALRWKVSYYIDKTSSTHKTPQIQYYYFGDTNDLLDAISTANRKQVDGRTYYFELEYKANAYTVTFNYAGATEEGAGTKSVTYDQTYGDLPVPKRLGTDPNWMGYSFAGWYDENKKEITKDTVMKVADDHTLTAKWEAQPLTYTLSDKDGLLGIKKDASQTITITVTGGSGSYKFDKTSGSDDNFKWNFDTETNKLKVTAKKKDQGCTIEFTVQDTVYLTKKTIEAKWSSEKSCVAEGTLITMADGTRKAIEDLRVGDMVMSWSFITGKLEVQPIVIFWDHGLDEYQVINLNFSDGNILRIIGSHGLFDRTTNRFEYIDLNNYLEYMGHEFATDENAVSTVRLIAANVTTEHIGCYSLETAQNGNVIANGLLTLTPQVHIELFMFEELGENMKFDEKQLNADIAEYGLYTYEEWADFVTKEEFMAFNGMYMKIVVGKGILTEEQLIALLLEYL